MPPYNSGGGLPDVESPHGAAGRGNGLDLKILRSHAPAGYHSHHPGKPGELRNARVVFAIALYATCSSTMLVLNKLAVHHIQAPSFVMFCQFAASALVVGGAAKAGVVKADAFDWGKVKAFSWVVAAFVAAIFTNMKTLQYANVETFIVFRSSTPLLVAFLDFGFLGRCLPSARSYAALFFILLGAVLYMKSDSHFELRSYAWACAWYAVFCFDQIYIKHVCNTVKMTTWGRVLYTNAMSVPLSLALAYVFNEDKAIARLEWSFRQGLFLSLSCVAGVAMSYSAFLLRQSVSATSFTVVGIMCKIATVIINLMIWDNHATAFGLASLMLCLGAGTFYKQSPMRMTKDKPRLGL